MRRRPATWLRRAAMVVAVLALLAPAGPPAAAEDPAPSPPAAAGAGSPVAAGTVGLVTGDTVTLHTFADGNQGVEVTLADRGAGERVSYEVVDQDGQLYVFPSDVQALVGHRLDRELFNVTKLVSYGYHLAHGLPVIAVPPAGGPFAAVRSLAPVPGVEASTPLPSVGGQAFRVAGGDPAFWRAAAGARRDDLVRTLAGPLAGVGTLWLDEQIEAALEQSVPMTGAPQAWADGYDGSGSTVAVLDTGVDPDHPDLAGQVAAAESFVPGSDGTDHNGHGTHVAGIVAGTGAASDGRLVGVAPGARLLSGKVLGDNGSGAVSWIIQGMEWAAGAGADVVNLSLGSSSPSAGTDLLSRAVDQLTAEHDLLFVVSAGNLGPGSWSIASPGAASAALTVGAVDKSGNLPSWSSRGPRYVPRLAHLIGGEFAVKPDLTAPGASIVSARAGGTSLGTPVGEHYTTLSGTSMAAPHVAGAVAIVHQQRPELGAAGLKAALVGTAAPEDRQTVYQQGGGQLDIPAALSAPVTVSPAPVDFGAVEHPYQQTGPTSVDVTYTNRQEQPLVLDLSVAASSRESGPAAPGVLAVEPARLPLAPGESAVATVTLDPAGGERGVYGGYLVAAGPGGTAASRVPVGFHLAPPTHRLTIEGVDRLGAPAGGLSRVDIVDAHDLNTYHTSRLLNLTGGAVTLEVPEGTYSVLGRLHNPHPEHGQERSVVALPEVPVTGDMTVVLDARTAQEITVATPDHQTRPLPYTDQTFGYRRQTEAGQDYAVADSASAGWPVYVAAVDEPALGEFDLLTRWLLGTEDATVLYDLALVESGDVPAGPAYSLPTSELAEVVHTYHSDLPHQTVRSARFLELPGWEEVELSVLHDFNVPVRRTEYYVGDRGAHRQRFNLNGSTRPSMFTEAETYHAGQTEHRSWFAGPMAPGLRRDRPAASRHDGTLRLAVAPWVDAAGNALEGPVEFAFFRDGELVQAGTDPRTLPLAAGPAEYRLELTAAVDRSWWRTSHAATTAWTLPSTPDDTGAVPLLQLGYDLDLDLTNTAPRPGQRPGPPVIGVQVGYQSGAAGGPIAGARLSTSYDDGVTWRQRPGREQRDGRFEFVLDHRGVDTSGFVSLRMEAWDAAGNRIEQEIMRAYALPPRDGGAGPEPAGTTEVVSVAGDGSLANRGSSAPPAISADGRLVAFASLATNLAPGDDPNLAGGVFLHDRETGRTERVSVASDGTPATGVAPALSPDGRFVAFASTSPELVPGKTGFGFDVFVHDRQTGHTEWVSMAGDGGQGDAGASSQGVSISADGRFVAFSSHATNLVPGDTNNAQDVFVHDRATGTTERVSVASDGTETGRFTSSSAPALSADGRLVAFDSSGDNLVPGDTNNAQDVFVHDRATGTTQRVSVASGGGQPGSFSSNPSISGDGRYVAFQSFASDLVPGDSNNLADAFVHDLVTGATERVSVASDGTQGDGFTGGPAISADGRYVGFPSGAGNLVPGDTNDAWDTFRHDRATGGTVRVSVAGTGAEANQASGSPPALSAAGAQVAFMSDASNLLPGDINRQQDIFLRDLGEE